MLLDQLEFKPYKMALPAYRYASFPLLGHYVSVIRRGSNEYTISLYCGNKRAPEQLVDSWHKLDALTAQAVLFDIAKKYGDKDAKRAS